MSTPPTDARHHGALDNPETAHEHSDINVRAVLWFVATLVVVAFLVHVSMYGLMVVFEHQAAKNDPFVTPLARPSGTLPPEPRLQTTPHVDLRLFVGEEDQQLANYGWIDKNAGIVRLPIERAKTLLLERGLPTRSGAQDPTEGTHVAAGGESNGGRTIPAGGPDLSGPPAPAAPASAPELPRGAVPKKPGGGV
jgi:hypothetical protein